MHYNHLIKDPNTSQRYFESKKSPIHGSFHKRFNSKNFRIKALDSDEKNNSLRPIKTRNQVRNATLEPYKARDVKNLITHEANDVIQQTNTGTYSPERRMN